MPGVGKTQLALKYASLAFEKGQYPYVFWVSGASVEKLSRDFSKLVDLVGLHRQYALDQASKLTMARSWLEDPTAASSWLFILDNAGEETIAMLRDVLPRRNPAGRLLITTRITKIADIFNTPGGLSRLALQPLKVGDAVAMLSAAAEMERESIEEANHAEAERLIRSVGNLPLAIDQAASYIRDTGSSLQEVLNIYNGDEAMEVSKE